MRNHHQKSYSNIFITVSFIHLFGHSVGHQMFIRFSNGLTWFYFLEFTMSSTRGVSKLFFLSKTHHYYWLWSLLTKSSWRIQMFFRNGYWSLISMWLSKISKIQESVARQKRYQRLSHVSINAVMLCKMQQRAVYNLTRSFSYPKKIENPEKKIEEKRWMGLVRVRAVHCVLCSRSQWVIQM